MAVRAYLDAGNELKDVEEKIDMLKSIEEKYAELDLSTKLNALKKATFD